MASTDQVRQWYHQTVLNHSQRGTPGFEPECNWGIAVTLGFPRVGGVFNEPVHPATVSAWEAYIELMNVHDVKMPSAGGVNSCRNIANTNSPSLHAYLVACDMPPNSYKPQAFIDDVEALRTNSGAQVFLNGAVFNDRMHDQINCSPEDIASGISLDGMVTRDTKADDGNSSLAANFQAMIAAGVMSEHTQPGGVGFNDELATFLIRYEAYLAAKYGWGGLTEDDVKALINDSNVVAPE